MIAITTSTDRGYLPAACCQLASVASHLGPDADAELFLVCCDVAPSDVAEARRFFATRGMQVEILQPTDVIERIQVLDTRWPRAAYLRLHFDSLFERRYDRLVYFDADTRVRAPLGPLLGADLRGNPVAAVHDFIYYVTGNIRRRRRDLFLAPDAPYLQSGVMVFDWPLTLDRDLLARARRFLADHPERCLEAPDQDALNATLAESWTPLDPRWNLHELYMTFGGGRRPYLEHYTSTKPWSHQRPAAWLDAAAWYRDELEGTAWEDFVEPQTTVDALLARARFLRFRYGPKVRSVLRHTHLPARLVGPDPELDDQAVLPWAPRNRKVVEAMTEALILEAARCRPPIRPPEAALAGLGPLP